MAKKRSAAQTRQVSAGQLPPLNIEAEQAVLGSILRDADALQKVTPFLQATHFYREAHAIVYRAMVTLDGRGEPCDNVTVCNQLQSRNELEGIGGPAYIALLINSPPTSANVEHYGQIVLDLAMRRRVLDEVGKLATSAYSLDGEFSLVTHIERLGAIHKERRKDAPFSETLAQLLDREFPPLRWRVDGLIADGALTVFAGKPKIGKGFLSLQLAQAVAHGTTFLGRDCARGSVLYLALEDGARRIQRRLKMQLAEHSDLVEFIYDCPPLDSKEGFLALMDEVERHQPDLLIIDTFSGSKSGKFDENVAKDMAPLINRLRKLAQDRDLAVWAIFHHGKITSGDAILDLRGSSAIGAAADSIGGIYKDPNGEFYILSLEGRDVPETSLRITWDRPNTFCWFCQGDHRRLTLTDAEQETLETLKAMGEADTSSLAKAMGKGYSTIKKALERLEKKDRVAHRITKTSTKSKKVMYRATELEELEF